MVSGFNHIDIACVLSTNAMGEVEATKLDIDMDQFLDNKKPIIASLDIYYPTTNGVVVPFYQGSALLNVNSAQKIFTVFLSISQDLPHVVVIYKLDGRWWLRFLI